MDGPDAGTTPGTPPEAPTPGARYRRALGPGRALDDLWRHREMVVALAERDLRARYQQSVLGAAWAVVTPLLLTAVFAVVFTRVADVETGDVPYALFAYLGLLVWTFFATSITSGGQSLLANATLLNRAAFPREVFPIAGAAVALVDLLVAALVLVAFSFVVGSPLTLGAQTLPAVAASLAVLGAFTVAGALVVSAVIVYLRDLRHSLALLLQVGLFATPVAYGLDDIALHRTLYATLNPLAAVIDTLRRTLLYGEPPEWGLLGTAAAVAVAALVVAYAVFKRLETGFADLA